MKKPHDYISQAVLRVRSQLAANAETMAHGEERAAVVRVGSVSHGEDEMNGESPAEHQRVLALFRDFPTLVKGELVSLGESRRIVTGVRADMAGASVHVGLSSPLEECDASVSGVRSGGRRVRFSCGFLVLSNGTAMDIADGFAPSSVPSWTLCANAEDWPVSGEPQIGDEISFVKDGRQERVRVSRCVRRGRNYTITARGR